MVVQHSRCECNHACAQSSFQISQVVALKIFASLSVHSRRSLIVSGHCRELLETSVFGVKITCRMWGLEGMYGVMVNVCILG